MKNYLSPPVFPGDIEKTYQASFLNAVTLGLLVVSVLLITGNLLFPAPTLGSNIVVLFCLLVLRIMLFRGQVRRVGLLLIVGSLVTISLSIVLIGTIRTPAVSAYLMLVVFSGLFFGRKGMIYTTVSASLCVFVLVQAERAGLLPRANFSVNLSQWISLSAFFALTAYLAYEAQQLIQNSILAASKQLADRELAEQLVREKEAYYRALMENSAEGLVVIDAAGVVTYDSPANSRLTGYLPGERSRYNVLELVYPEDQPALSAALLRAQSAPGQLEKLELRFVGRAGEPWWAELSITNLLQHPDVLGLVVHFQDIGDRKKSQDVNLQQQRQLAVLEEREHLGRDLHDGLGQTMGYINVESQAAMDFLNDGNLESAQSSLTEMSRMAQAAHSDIRRYILGLRAPVMAEKLPVTLELVLRQLEKDTGIHASLSMPADATIPDLPANVEEQILRIVQEALANVRKHATAQRVEVLLTYNFNRVQLIISDDGAGFNLEARRNETVERRFGLEIMRERARLVGGSLEIRSRPGAGTKVLFEIPVQHTWSNLSGESAEAAEPRLPRLLLVDDSLLFLDGLHNLLRARGFMVVGVAHDGLEAQEQVRLLQPDLVVMDIEMPNCNGLQATRAINAEFPQIKIVMLTAWEQDDTLMEAIKSGASGYLAKDLDADEFCRLLTSLFEGDNPLMPGVASRLLANLSGPAREGSASMRSTDKELSVRQWSILEMVATGMQYREVAEAMHLTESAIKYHMNQILARLNLDNRQQAINYANRLKNKRN